jgi:hypothetical protein
MNFIKISLIFSVCLCVSYTTSAKDFLPTMLQNMSQGKLTYEMAEIVAEKISYASLFKEAYNKANDYSVKICGVEGEERHSGDEVDAVRHFIGASILSSILETEYVKRLLTAHEERSDILNDENYMDINNNQLGIDFGPTIPYVKRIKKIKKKSGWIKRTVMVRDHTLAFFKAEVFKRISSGEFFTLKTGRSLCANPKVFPNMEV